MGISEPTPTHTHDGGFFHGYVPTCHGCGYSHGCHEYGHFCMCMSSQCITMKAATISHIGGENRWG